MILVIDNYDSFTYNLVQLLAELGGGSIQVRRNDACTLEDIASLAPAGLVLSPGPRTPAEAGLSVAAVRRFGGSIPILGVCLGHQAIGAAYGAPVVRWRRPVHGKTTPVGHEGRGLFAGLPSPVAMTRYHSLALDPERMPAELEIVAWTEEEGWRDEIQGIRHRNDPIWGVQFHPESVASPHGRTLLANFLEMTR